ncbi:simple sugar transport system ATP-binding protein/simple sugar transport system permease protein [Paenibacillus phyllosphaerae]|uniref:Simple sugar transport system ATP-binding protein/simple sugar transport system permease protein n=1 Tax=Paenibacillus phyllosphaerae TaxID=274593 RepID=A0A7W5AWU8_9BACL|nr:ABC transporter permease [Paenibacillus phyllosphaerae]MBB3110270.1 simple sugar transport system ATP-binding protein/simple sugar transport system permease protein [Paenibacillus phyllosphaerae]
MEAEMWVSYAAAAIRLSVPLMIAGLAILFMSRSGILNIGMEGMMLIGSLSGVLGAYYTGNVWGGVLTAMAVCGVVGLMFGFLVITTGADQVIIGTAMNLLGLGLTTVFGRSLLGMGTEAVQVDSIPVIRIPLLADIPWIGPALFEQNTLTYMALLLVPAVSLLLYRTQWGLQVRAVGENPLATDTLGVKVHRIRYMCCIIGGMLAGVAGSALSLGILNQFTENMVAGRGFIALSAVIFGRWTPTGTMMASLLFGGADALQLRFQNIAIPYQFMLMFPYVLTMAALAWFSGKAKQPAATGLSYKSAADRHA